MKSVLFVAFFFSSFLAFSQEFTLENEYAKQVEEYPQISPYLCDTVDVVTFNDVEYFDTLKCDIFLPQNIDNESLPLIIFAHGGGWLTGDKVLDHPLARSLASRGFATMTINYRTSDVARYPASIEDVEQAVDFARNNSKKYHFDVENIALCGSSSGGQMVSLVGTRNSVRVRAVIDIDGILDFFSPDSEEGKSASLWFGGTIEEKAVLYREASAINHITENSADFLFITSSRKRFSAGIGVMMEKLEENNHIAVRRETIETPHTFWLFSPWAENVVDWIEDFLRN